MLKERMLAWNLTTKTYMHVDEWKNYLKIVNTIKITIGLFLD